MNFWNVLLKLALFSPQVKALITLLRKTQSNTIRDFIFKLTSNPEQVARDLSTLTREERKVLALDLAETAGGGTQYHILKSSWIMSGSWEPVGIDGQVGYLTLTLKNGKSYTWPGVGRIVWDAMVKAPGGKNSGAGTIFWHYFLHSQKHSRGYRTTALAFKLAGVK